MEDQSVVIIILPFNILRINKVIHKPAFIKKKKIGFRKRCLNVSLIDFD